MNISDIRTRIEFGEKGSLVTKAAEQDEKSSLLTKHAEPDEPPVLTLADTAEESDVLEMPDPLIQALVNKLPKPNSVWSTGDRAKWLRAAAIIFNLVYKPAEADGADLKAGGDPFVLKSAG